MIQTQKNQKFRTRNLLIFSQLQLLYNFCKKKYQQCRLFANFAVFYNKNFCLTNLILI